MYLASRLLLFARCVHTNRDCTRFLVDDWIEVRLPRPPPEATVLAPAAATGEDDGTALPIAFGPSLCLCFVRTTSNCVAPTHIVRIIMPR